MTGEMIGDSPQSFLVEPARAPLSGEARVPGDKSIGHRAVLLAGLASGTSTVSGLSGGQDNARTVAALSALGAAVTRIDATTLTLTGRGLFGLRQPAHDIDCGNSGTSIRLLSGILAAQRFESRLTGDRYLCARPMRRVTDPLSRMGAVVHGTPGARPGELYPPLTFSPAAAPLAGIRYTSPIASAQVKSAILLCGLWADGVTEVVEPVRSRDHTERMLRALGVPLFTDHGPDGAVSRLDPSGWRRELPPFQIEVPGDLSSAAFLLGAALLVPGSRVTVRGVGLNPTRTGLLDALDQLCPGAVTIHNRREVGGEPVGDLAIGDDPASDLTPVSRLHPHRPLRAFHIDGPLAVRALDELPLLAALAGAAEGETVIAGAAELRVKESDRIAATCGLLRAFGVSCQERPDGMIIHGAAGSLGRLRPARVDSCGDHRIAMAGAVLALCASGPSRIEDSENVDTSFPGFVAVLSALGAPITISDQ